jgi:hypothetical protein
VEKNSLNRGFLGDNSGFRVFDFRSPTKRTKEPSRGRRDGRGPQQGWNQKR